MDHAYQVILCTCPDFASAEKIARTLIEGKSAACVNILPGLTSIYLWKGAIESESEFLLIAKTHSGHFRKVEAAILDNHPYELPEIIAVPVEQGHSAYLRWIDTCLSSNPF